MSSSGVAGPDARVVVVGAGPAGLSTAYWLKLRGYTRVTVLEKSGRVGGLCKSITVDGASFDLGANFVTRAYTNVRALAARFGAKMYSEKPFYVMEAPVDASQPVAYNSLFRHVRQHADGTTTSALVFMLAVLRYVWLRAWLSPLLDKPSFEGIAAHTELCVSFADWLRAQKFLGKDLHHYLGRLFQVPITMMGYGLLDATAAPYALKFMTLATFVPMCAKSVPWVGQYLTAWPKRFELGFQRLWERVSEELDVRTSVHIHAIERPEQGPIRVRYTTVDQNFNALAPQDGSLVCDVLVLACPLAEGALSPMLELSGEERRLFSKIESYDYCMTTMQVASLGGGLNAATGASAPLLCVFPEDRKTTGRPWAIAQAHPDVDFVQFYSRCDPSSGETFAAEREAVEQACKTMLSQMSLQNSAPPKPEAPDASWSTFDRWNYFQHVHPAAFGEGWYDALGAMQGQRRTFYVGGATNFELIEPIVAFSKHVVQTHFPGRSIWFPFPWKQLGFAVAVVLALVLGKLLPPDELYIAVPISHQSAEAQRATAAYWEAFHTQRYDQLPALIDRLERVHQDLPNDPIVSSLLGTSHLWRFVERRRVNGRAEDLLPDLQQACQLAQTSLILGVETNAQTSVPSTFSPAMHAVALWEIGRIQHVDHEINEAAYELVSNAVAVPEFDGFLLGWVTGALQAPNDRFARLAVVGLDEMSDACAGLDVPEDLVYRGPVMSVLAVRAWLSPKFRVCYNNPLAPHNLEGYFLAAGDSFVMAGRFDIARINYQNATRMPRYKSWPFRDVIESRLAADLPSLRSTFATQVNMLDIPLGQPATAMRSGHGCSYCHAR